MINRRNVLISVLILVTVLAVWEGFVRLFQIPVFILPTPSNVFMAFYRGVVTGIYAKHLWVTIVETGLGFLVGSTLAFALGIAVALNRRLEFFLYPYIIMFQSMPKVALAPLIVVWFGL